ncbi:MAG: rod shape-determining protein MreD [Gammaproteobacteria bacterium]|nr:rod shape-determining protein MreD [Gammaproteobacteria bacterium]
MNPTQGGWLILLTLAAAMVLAVVHLPETWPQWLGWLRPAWVAVVIFYWVMELPHRVGLIAAWILGLLVDALLAEPLGLNGLILAAITYVAWRFYERLRMYSVVQQCGVVFLLVLGAELLRALVLDIAADRPWSWGLIGPPLASLFVWPLASLVLTRLRVQFRVM